MYWGDSWWRKYNLPGCRPMRLLEGLLVSNNWNTPLQYISEAVYQQSCFKGRIPNMNTNIGLVVNRTADVLPAVLSTWKQFTTYPVISYGANRGSFAYSIVTIVYSLSISAVITWFLTIFVLTNYTIKASLLLKGSSILSSIYILVVVVNSLIQMHKQHMNGYLSSPELLQFINTSIHMNILDMVVVLLLQINQVQVIMRIFSRQKEKRLTLLIGLIASIMSQTIWSVSKFHRFSPDDEAGDILPAFIYLVRIAMAISYAAIITVFVLSKINDIIANRSIWLLSVLNLVLIYSPLAFFVADISNTFVYELSEIFSVVTYAICVVIPWEWCNKFNLIEKRKEKDGVLGRRFYEDELYELDKHEIFVENHTASYSAIQNDDNDHDPDNDHDGDGDINLDQDISENRTMLFNRNKNNKEFTNARKVLKALKSTKKTFITITDGIIAAGFAIPRSVSISQQSLEPKDKNIHLKDAHKLVPNPTNGPQIELNTLTQSNMTLLNDSTTPSVQGRHRRNVFLYSRQEVVIAFSEDEEDDEEEEETGRGS